MFPIIDVIRNAFRISNESSSRKSVNLTIGELIRRSSLRIFSMLPDRKINEEIPVRKVIRALGARLLFALHGLISLWRLASIYDDDIFWALSIFLLVLFLEGGIIIHQRNGNETRWFCPSVFLYLCSVVPAICLLQLDLCRKTVHRINTQNFTLFQNDYETTELNFLNDLKISIHIPFGQEAWVQLLQQSMMLVLILGRWILPKGDISRDHLSQILLVFLGMAADMVELFETFKESQISANMRLTTVVLGIWAVSLIQFPLVLTGVSPRKIRTGFLSTYYRVPIKNRRRGRRHRPAFVACRHFTHLLMADINFWGLISGIFLQDAPFLATRLYLLIGHNTVSYMMIFFTIKNMMVLLLQSYRFYVICLETYSKVKEARNETSINEGIFPNPVPLNRISSSGIVLPVQKSESKQKLHATQPIRSISQGSAMICDHHIVISGSRRQSCSSLPISSLIMVNNNVKDDEKDELKCDWCKENKSDGRAKIMDSANKLTQISQNAMSTKVANADSGPEAEQSVSIVSENDSDIDKLID